MGGSPSGTVTFLFTDVEGSTRLWEERPDEMRVALAEHDAAVRAAVAEAGGTVFATGGDGFAVVFGRASEALSVAAAVQRALGGGMLRVRVGVHTGEAQERDGDYFGPAVNRAARLMAVAHGGQVLVSGATAAIVGTAGLVDLGVHRLRDVAEPTHVWQLGDGAFPALRTAGREPTNLPVELNEFVGRESEVTELCRLLDRRRLVTVTGVGGAGKTRLAVRAARLGVGDHEDGVWFTDLSGVSDPADVAQALASVLALRQRPGRTVAESVAELLAHRQMLLVVDNCEHVIDAVRELVALLLERCPQVDVLATSRSALGLAGEHVLALGSLPVPAAGASGAEVAQVASVRLLCIRAEATRPGFEIDAGNERDVAELCRRLEGIPLALELAAARMRMMSPREALDRLEHRFRLLASPDRAHGRHGTLRAAIEWSHSLLAPPEQLLLARLSVFAGRFTLDDAEHVCAGDGLEATEVMDVLGRLVDRSLVVADHEPGKTCFRLLEMVREFAAELVDPSGGALLRDRFADWAVALAEQVDAGLQGPDEESWLRRVTIEGDNLRAAAAWLEASGDEARALRLGTAVMWAGFILPATGLTDVAALAWRMSSPARGPSSHAVSLAAASAAVFQADVETVERILGEVAPETLTAWGWWAKGTTPLVQGDAALGLAAFRRAVDVLAPDHRALRTFLLSAIATVAAAAGDLVAARAASEEAVRTAATIGSSTSRADALWGRAMVLGLGEHDPRAAVEVLEDAERHAVTVQVAASIAANLGHFHLDLGEDRAALSGLRRSIELADRHGEYFPVVWTLEFLLTCLSRIGPAEAVARIHGHLRSIGYVPMAYAQLNHDEGVRSARAALGAVFDELSDAGGRTSTPELLAWLRRLLDGLASG